jgi:hypothetical protein
MHGSESPTGFGYQVPALSQASRRMTGVHQATCQIVGMLKDLTHRTVPSWT